MRTSSPCFVLILEGERACATLNQNTKTLLDKKRGIGRCQKIKGNRSCLKQKQVLHPDLGCSSSPNGSGATSV